MVRKSALLVALLLAGSAAAQTVPFVISGVGTAPDGLPLPPPLGPANSPRPHNIVGLATHLGLHTGEGMVQTDTLDTFDPAAGVITGKFKGNFTFEKKNGSKLATNYGNTEAGASLPGEYTINIVGVTEGGDFIVTAFFVAEFVVDPAASTGQFAGASGSWVMYAQTGQFVLGSSDPLSYGWVGAGTLTYPNK